MRFAISARAGVILYAASLGCGADETPTNSSSAGSSGSSPQSAAGASGQPSGGQSASAGAGGAPTGGSGGGEGGGSSGTGGAGGVAGSAGAGGTGGAVTASCQGTVHPLCLDFESGKVDAPWAAPKDNTAVEKSRSAHGQYAVHLSNLHAHPQLFLHTEQMGTIKDVLWGRYYLFVDPGAPVGHGAFIRAFDQQTNWYELGFESNAYLGNWHVLPAGVPEKYLRSKFVIPKAEWVCVEFQFDGSTAADAKVWSDGVPIVFDDIAKSPDVQKANQFESFDIGIVFYHGTSLTSYEGDDAPYLSDMWLDDIALDTTRVGCL